MKVHEDEEKHRQEQDARRKKQETAEQEFRTNIMRKRTLKDRELTDSKIEHVNFFKEEELNQEDPESKVKYLIIYSSAFDGGLGS